MARIKKTTVKEETEKVNSKKAIIEKPVKVEEVAEIVEDTVEDKVEDNKEAEIVADIVDETPQVAEPTAEEEVKETPKDKETEVIPATFKKIIKNNMYAFGYTWNGMSFD